MGELARRFAAADYRKCEHGAGADNSIRFVRAGARMVEQAAESEPRIFILAGGVRRGSCQLAVPVCVRNWSRK